MVGEQLELSEQLAPVHDRSPVNKARRSAHVLSAKRIGPAAAALFVSALYLTFVAHYSANVPYEDDWTIVPLIHAFLHGHFSLGPLWALHEENRMLVPNLVFVGLGDLTHDNLATVTVFSALLSIAAFLICLVVVRSYQKRPLTFLFVLVLGALWYSTEDWLNALWAFQVAWYLILFFLMAMIYFLVVSNWQKIGFSLAIACAILASFSFIHGLALWPTGFVCLVWTLPRNPRLWNPWKRLAVLIWVGAAFVTTVISLWGYNFQPPGCIVRNQFQINCSGGLFGYVLHHPLRMVEFVLVEIGEVLPNANANTLWLNGVLGAAILTAAAYVVVQSVRHRRNNRNCLPTALILFGLIFDIMVAVARVYFLSAAAPSSSYTMPNLLILSGIVIYGWVHLRTIRGPNRRIVVRTLATSALMLLVIQFALSTRAGIIGARGFDQHQTIAARLVVNLNEVPVQERGCYSYYGVLPYLIFDPGVFEYPAFGLARDDHLSVFSAGPLEMYRKEGLPSIPQCQSK